MASPFDIFRKNQKFWLAAITLMAIFAFVFLGTLQQGATDSTGREDPAVVTWRYGTIHESDISQTQMWNNVLNEFFQAAVSQSPIGQLMNQMPYGSIASQLGIPIFPTDEESIVRTMLLAHKAEKLGMHIGDDYINERIKRATLNSVTRDQLNTILRNIEIGGRRVTQGQLYEAMRPTLLAQAYEQMVLSGVGPDTPASRWDGYTDLNRPVTAQVLPVPVEDFIDEVPEPTERELKAFYQQYNDEVREPVFVRGRQLQSPEPAFKQPYRAQFQFFKADKNRFVERLIASDEITDEDIREYYEANKQRFTVRQLPVDTAAPAGDGTRGPAGMDTISPAGETTAAPSGEGTAGPAGEGTLAPTGEGTRAPAGEGTTADGRPSGANTNAAAAQELRDAAGVDEPAAETQNDNPETDDAETSAETDDDSAAMVRENDLIIRGQDEEEPAADEPTEAVPPAGETTGGTGEPSPSAAPAGDSTRDANAPTAPAPAGESTAPARESTTGTGTATAAEMPEAEYEPLEKVREQIRKEIAQQRAPQKIQVALDAIRDEILDYKSEKVLYEVHGEGDPDVRAPDEPEYQELAEKYELQFTGDTPMLSQAEAAASRTIPYGGNDAFTARAFDPAWPNLDPAQARDIEDNLYLIWKVDQQESEIPAFEEIRDEVVRAWKMQKAQELALAKARELAKQASQENRTLKDLFGDKVLEVGPFTALTFGSTGRQQQQAPVLTELPQLPQVGPEFMDVATSLPLGEAGVALNHPKTVAYVVEPTGEGLSAEVLRIMFTTTDYQDYSVATSHQKFEAVRNWYEQLEEEANLHWERPPQSMARRF